LPHPDETLRGLVGEETANQMLAIRCAIYNGTYDKVFEKYKEAQISI
jgi:hypothetical protein